MNIGGFVTIFFVLIAVAWGFWLIFKRDLMAVNLAKLISYFVGVIITLIIILWITSQFLPWWAVRLVENTRQSTNIELLQQVSQDMWNEAINGDTVVISTPVPPGTQPVVIVPQPQPTVSPVGTPGVSSFGVSPSSEVVHIVQQGDTLYSIGRRYGVSADAIRIRNGLASNLIVPGQRLTIPAQ